MHVGGPDGFPFRRVFGTGALLACLGWSLGCSLVHRAADAPGHAVRLVSSPGGRDVPVVGPADLDALLIRFAEFYLLNLSEATADVEGEERVQTNRIALGQWRLRRAHAALSLASGPNPYANLLDFGVAVSLDSLKLEAEPPAWMSAAQTVRLQNTFRNLEGEIWRIARLVLDPATIDSFRESIAEWKRQGGEGQETVHGLAQELAVWFEQRRPRTANRPGSLLGVLSLDPLAGLDPATREIAEARRLAERALFVTRALPHIVAWEIQLLSLRTVDLPESQQALGDWSRVTASAEMLARTAEQLPDRFSAERKAILTELDRQSDALKALAAEMGSTLDSGNAMAGSLTQTITAFDALMGRFGVGQEEPTEPQTPGRPFDITEYGATAEQIAAMSRDMTRLIEGLQATLDSPALDRQREALEQVADRLEDRTRSLLREAALIAAGLILLAGGVAFAVRRSAAR